MKNITKYLATLLFMVTFCATSFSQDPGTKKWSYYDSPEEAGFSGSSLKAATEYAESIGTSALFVVLKGKVVLDWGNTRRNYMCHSIWKSLNNALYGIHVEQGHIDLESTLEKLGVDDDTPLTQEEKQAKVIHLLKSRSGIYLPAAAESTEMRAARPERGSHAPDEHFYYNNWSFNVLGSIFEQETGKGIFDEFYQRIAQPLGMQDYDPQSCNILQYQREYSRHPSWRFRMSARDLARFGQLYLQNGIYDGQEILTEKWVKETSTKYSDGEYGEGYGLLWWVMSKGTNWHHWGLHFPKLEKYRYYYANGYGNHLCMVIPAIDMVIVHRVDTDVENMVDTIDLWPLLEMILEAQTEYINDIQIQKVVLRGANNLMPDKDFKHVIRIFNDGNDDSSEVELQVYLSRNKKLDKRDSLLLQAQLAPIRAERRKSFRQVITIPDTVRPGKYNLITKISLHNDFDPQQGNNISVNAITIH